MTPGRVHWEGCITVQMAFNLGKKNQLERGRWTRELRSHLTHQRPVGHMTKEAQRIVRRLMPRKCWTFLARRLKDMISSFPGGDPIFGWGFLFEGKPPISITDPEIWHTC